MFWEWSKPDTATVTGKISLRKVEELVAETTARDGEQFVRLIRGKGINRFGFSLQLIEPDWIDEKYNLVLPNGNLIVMGVELDVWRRPVAYHVAVRNTSLGVYGNTIVTGPYERIPASDMIHIYDPERADQTRGMSWMASGMVKSRHLDGYIEAAVVNSRASACKMGIISEETPEGYHRETARTPPGTRRSRWNRGQWIACRWGRRSPPTTRSTRRRSSIRSRRR